MKCIKWLDKNLELAIMAIMLAVMSVLSFVNVIMRYFFHSALSWSDEVCCYCLALSSFFALSCAIRLGTSIRVDTFVTLLSKKVQNLLELVCSVIMLVFLAFLLKGTLEIAANAAKIGQASPALRIPLVYLYGVMAFAVVLAMLRYVQAIVKNISGKSDKEGEN